MNKTLTQVFAVVVGGLAILGLFTGGHLFNLMNTDLPLDIIRVGLAGLLIYAATSGSRRIMDRALAFLGILYIGVGLLGLVDSELFGLLPSGLTGFDIAFHLLTGLVAAWAGLSHRAHNPTHFTAARSR